MAGYTRREILGASLAALLEITGCTKLVEKISTATSVPPTSSFDTQTHELPKDQSPPLQPAINNEPTATVNGCQQLRLTELYNPTTLDTWYVSGHIPTFKEEGNLMTLSGTDMQSNHVYNDGVLEGVISSSDWKPHTQFTDSSFGLETWSGDGKNCHCGILFKANGHLAVLRANPDINEKCFGDPQDQMYPPIPNWDSIREGQLISFKLTWRPDSVTLWASGNGEEGEISYKGIAIPDVPLHIRLYSQTDESYEISKLQICGDET